MVELSEGERSGFDVDDRKGIEEERMRELWIFFFSCCGIFFSLTTTRTVSTRTLPFSVLLSPFSDPPPPGRLCSSRVRSEKREENDDGLTLPFFNLQKSVCALLQISLSHLSSRNDASSSSSEVSVFVVFRVSFRVESVRSPSSVLF